MTSTIADEFLEIVFGLDVSLGEIKHGYDPIKAREYYLRTRQLKGRTKGSDESTKTYRSQKLTPAAHRPKAQLTKKEKSDRLKRLSKERVAQLKTRLEKLEKVLDQLTEEAKARSGVETKTSSSSSSTSTSKSSSTAKPKTAAQKRKDAEAAKEQRAKENPGAAAEAKQLEQKIHAVRERISKMKAELAESRKKVSAKKNASVAKSKSKTA